VQGSREPLRRTWTTVETGHALCRSRRSTRTQGRRLFSAQTRQLSLIMWQPGVRKTLLELARDYDELAEDLERGTAAIRHPELLPRRSA
jgi:hypothetical protein